MKMAPARLTDGIAAVTFMAFLPLALLGQAGNAAVRAGFMPARLGDPALMDGLVTVPIWLTPISGSFIHASWLYLGFNLLMLVFCGRQVEQVLGMGAMLLLYGGGAYGAAFAQWAVDPLSTDPMMGASGAVSAVIATYALLYSRQRVRAVGPFSANLVRIAWLAAAWIVVQAMIAIAMTGFRGLSELAIAGQVGAFLTGLALTRPLLRWRFRKRPRAVH